MRIIPVIDLKGGIVVRAIAGHRDQYQPVSSRLAADPSPAAVACGFSQLLGSSEIYVADLDAIAGADPDWRSLEAIAASGLRILLDCGVGSPQRAAAILDACRDHTGIQAIIVGLESLERPADLETTRQAIGERHAVFSLDMRDGHLWNAGEAWHGWSPRAVADRVIAAGYDRLIVLDIGAVGRDRGPIVGDLCREIRDAHPGIPLIAGGGIRHAEDLTRLAQRGCDAVLVASALHDGRLSRDTILACTPVSRQPEMLR